MVAIGVRVPGAGLARAVASRILCAASLADGCGDEPTLIAAYGTEIGELVRRHMPMLAFEPGARAVPVDFRRCRSSACGDSSGSDGSGGDEGSGTEPVHRTDAGLPVTAFVHVVDCRARKESYGADCSPPRAGSLYIQYWLYYADSATLRDLPVAGEEGYHRDDWEGVQIRIGPDGEVDERASSHNGYNHSRSVVNWASDAGLDLLRDGAEAIGAREANGWGPETGILLVSGGSHAGNAAGLPHVGNFTPGRRVHLIPLEPVAASDASTFAITPPWRKHVWRDPEAAGTD
ncbi:MAG TPA: hypothetical protein VGO36_08825 [Solirubrobacterales bacterium]|nr:hypothetical protein [Solirubrobacterales bacterium]